jgi:hypothetical protein
MSKPVSPKPLRKVAAICAYSQDDPPLRNPIIGIAVCCARAASGYATHRRTAQQCDELASFHSITSSARASSVGGSSRPSDFS